jgi:dsDNA-binding SOS-regulon protein
VDVWRFVDQTGAERLDMNDPDAWLLGRGLVLGRQPFDKTYISQAPFSGATLATSTPLLVQMQVPLNMQEQDDVDDMLELMDALATELTRTTNIIEGKLPGASTSFFLDTFKTDIPTLIQGVPSPNPYLMGGSVFPVLLDIDRMPDIHSEVDGGDLVYV